MIRSRLTVVFALLATLAIAQSAFTFWATQSAARYAEQSLVATTLLNHYLELGANKQRLKVWFAQATLAGDLAPEVRDRLLGKMRLSINELERLVDRDGPRAAGVASGERVTIDVLRKNFAALTNAIDQAMPTLLAPAAGGDKARGWSAIIEVFDRSEGRDMRVVLEDAVKRQRAISEAAETDLTAALDRVRIANVAIALFSLSAMLLAVAYFVTRMQRPFKALVASTEALAHGEYAHQNPNLSADEFGVIARQLNAVAATLDAARLQSEAVRSGLDDAVAARTDALSRSQDALLRIDQRRRQFFADISHELRTPVTVIRGEAEVALRSREATTSVYRDSLSRIVSACAALAARVDDLLKLARTDAAAYALTLTPTPLRAIVDASTQAINAVAQNRGVTLTTTVTPTANEGVIEADRERLQQALIIVLDNAVRYSEAGATVSISCSLEDDHAWISVTDQGIGLSEDELVHAFERHFRGTVAKALRPEGAGLGLAIARDIVTAHHGEIAIASATPRGACVTLRLPLAATAPAAAVATAAAAVPVVAASVDAALLRGAAGSRA